jgi:hypothetical protein
MLGAKQTLEADEIVSRIRSELESKSTPEGIRRFKRFFKEEISCYGLMSAQIEEIVKKYYSYIEGDMNLALIDRTNPSRWKVAPIFKEILSETSSSF